MNISPINYAQTNSKFSKIEAGKKCVISDNQPVPETPKDEVAFKGSYEKVLKEAMSAKLTATGDVASMFEKIFNVILKDSKVNGIKKTDEFFTINRLLDDNSFDVGYFFKPLMRKFAGFDRISSDGEEYMINQLQKKLAEGDITLATVDDMPVFELRKKGLKGTKSYKTAFAPSNIYEFKFTNSRGGSEIIMGINKKGEISVERNSNIAMPKYTLFHKSQPRDGVKVLMNGKLGDEHFVGKFYNRFGWYDPILSMFIR